MLVQALVPQLAVEALHEAVLLRLARRDVVPFDAVVLGPLEHGISGELGSVVGDDHLWLATLGHDPIERAGQDWGIKETKTANFPSYIRAGCQRGTDKVLAEEGALRAGRS